MPPVFSRNYLVELIPVVRIHGNWCGPNWTGGQRVAAEDYQGNWNGPVDSPLDAFCRSHDRDCAENNGCTRAGDTRLIEGAESRILNPRQELVMQVRLANPFLSRGDRAMIHKRLDESSDAFLVASGIEIARLFRRT